MYIDAHAHLADHDFDDRREEVISNARTAKIEKICLIASSFESADQAFKMVEDNPDLFDVAVGFHPTDIINMPSPDYSKLEAYLKGANVVAVGEIGLDYYWNKENKQEQIEAFVRQIELANQLDLPIQVHSRDALQETFDVLKKHPVHRKGMIHCYSGSYEMALEFIKLGFFISLGGPVTFKNAKTPKEVAEKISLDHLISETDSPYLTPHPFRGKPNESKYVPYVVEEIARLKGMSVEDVAAQIANNYNHLYHPATKR